MKVLFNIVAVLVWQKITSLARSRTWLAKDLTLKANPRTWLSWPRPRPRTTTPAGAVCIWQRA